MNFEAEGIVLDFLKDPLGSAVQIRYYGLIIVLAMLVAALVAARLARRDGRDPEHIWGGLTWAIIPGIILARLWFVFFPSIALTAGCATESTTDVCRNTAWLLQNFFDTQNGAIAIWSGGLSIFGAVLGGLLGAYLYMSHWHNRIVRFFNRFWWVLGALVAALFIGLGITNSSRVALVIGIILAVIIVLWMIPRTRPFVRRVFGSGEENAFPEEGMPLGPWLDIAAVALPLGQAIGRWANWVNQELYGTVTTLPWGITIESAKRVAPYSSTIDFPVATTLFHPLFLYESLLSFLAFIVLLNIFQRQRRRLLPGDIFLLYVMQYAVVRFLLEFLRVEVTVVGNVNWSQVVSVAGFLVALVLFIYRHRAGAVSRLDDSAPASNTTA